MTEAIACNSEQTGEFAWVFQKDGISYVNKTIMKKHSILLRSCLHIILFDNYIK